MAFHRARPLPRSGLLPCGLDGLWELRTWVPREAVPASESCSAVPPEPAASAPHSRLTAGLFSALHLFGLCDFLLLCCSAAIGICVLFLFSWLFQMLQEGRGNTLLAPPSSSPSSPFAFCPPGTPGNFQAANFIFPYVLVLFCVYSFKTCIFSVISLRFWQDR